MIETGFVRSTWRSQPKKYINTLELNLYPTALQCFEKPTGTETGLQTVVTVIIVFCFTQMKN